MDDITAIRNGIEDLSSAVDGTTTKRIVVILCGTQVDGTITPVLVDANGKLVLSSS